MNNDRINIVYVTDKTYFDYMITSIESLIRKTKSEINIKVFLSFQGGIKKSEPYKNYFSKYSNLTIEFLDFDISEIKNIEAKNHVSISAYIKVYLEDLLNDWNETIYLDSDLILEDDISNLWSLRNNDILLQAVWNPKYNFDNHVFGLEKEDKTFNSGVMILNLNQMREEKTKEKLLLFLKTKNHLTKLNDQAAFNAIFVNRWGELPLKWNVTYQFFLRRSKYLGISKKEKISLQKNPSIVHFTTGSKPWKFRSSHPYKNEFQNIYKSVINKPIKQNKTMEDLLKKIVEEFRLKSTYFF